MQAKTAASAPAITAAGDVATGGACSTEHLGRSHRPIILSGFEEKHLQDRVTCSVAASNDFKRLTIRAVHSNHSVDDTVIDSDVTDLVSRSRGLWIIQARQNRPERCHGCPCTWLHA